MSDSSESTHEKARRPPRKGVVQDHLRVKYKLTLEDMSHYVYCGSDNKNGPVYFQDVFKGRINPPQRESECVCETPIQYNFYIRDWRKPASQTDRREILVIGSCCIKQFTTTGIKRTCIVCAAPHQRKKTLVCHACRDSGVCESCLEKHAPVTMRQGQCVLCQPNTRETKQTCASCGNLHRRRVSQVCFDCRDDGVCERCYLRDHKTYQGVCTWCRRQNKTRDVLTASAAATSPAWVDTRHGASVQDLCDQWEERRVVTSTHLYMFKHEGTCDPCTPDPIQIKYVRYKLPADPDTREEMLQMLDPVPELHWRPFLCIAPTERAAARVKNAPFTLVFTTQRKWAFWAHDTLSAEHATLAATWGHASDL